MNPLRSARRRRLTTLLAACAAAPLLAAPGSAQAQLEPAKPIKLVIPFPAGGSSDGVGRLVAERMAQLLKATVVVENKGGAGGVIGTDVVAKSPPDGHTLALVDVFHTSMPVYTRKMPYDAVRDFTPVSLIGRSPAFLVAGPGLEARSARDALAWARANPDKLTMAIAGTGSVVVDLFRARSGVKFLAVPYKGSSPALIDVMSGQTQVMITTMASAGAHVKSGKLRALAATGTRRVAEWPDVPTFAEAGVAGMDYEQWFGVLGPAGMPKATVDRLAGVIEQVLKMPDVRERLAGLSMDVASGGAAEMKQQLEGDAARWVKLARELDLKPLD